MNETGKCLDHNMPAKVLTYRGPLNLAEKGLRRVRGWEAKPETFKLTRRCDFVRLR